MTRRSIVWTIRLTVLVLLFALWAYGTGPGGVSRLLLPPLSDTASSFWELVSSDHIWYAFMTTVFEICCAAIFALFVGFGAGFLLTRSRFRTLVFEPLFAWGYMIPFVLFYPVLIFWIGPGIWSKVAYGAINGLFPIALNAFKGFSSVDAGLLRTARAYGASPRQSDLLIKFPAALPMCAAGTRIGLAVTMITVILAEMLGSKRGLGFELTKATGKLQIDKAFAIIVLILALVAVVHFSIRKLEISR